MRVILISCASKKLPRSAKAKDIYISPIFKGAYRYAKKVCADKIFILSAKYGLLEEDEIIEPYDETLNSKSQKEIKVWAHEVLKSLEKFADLDSDEFIFLAGEKYRRYLVSVVKHSTVPLQGLSIGKQLAFYKEND